MFHGGVVGKTGRATLFRVEYVYIYIHHCESTISGGRPRLRKCARLTDRTRLVRQGIVKYLPNGKGKGFGGTFGGTFGIERYSELNFLRREANDMHPYDHRMD